MSSQHEARMLERLREQVPAPFVDQYEEEAGSGEPVLALENLLDNLIEDDVAVTRGLADDLQQLARSLGITRNSIAYLENLATS